MAAVRAAGARAALAGVARDGLAFGWPQRCPACGAEADPRRLLCTDCLARVPRPAFALCARCLATGREPVGCTAHPGRQVWSAWIYDERAALVVQALKYRERPGLAVALGAEMAAALPPGLVVDVVVEVPLHPVRRRERGYNQAAGLAESLADHIGAPHAPGTVARTRPTQPQARLGPRERRHNLAGAFRVPRPARVAGRRVLVVDDVITTGATLEACGAALEAAGAHPVAVTLAWAQ